MGAFSRCTVWVVALDGYCASNKQGFKEISINEITGEFSLFNYYKIDPNAWNARITGNLLRNEVKTQSVKGGSRLKAIEAEKDGEAWNLALRWHRSNGGQCTVKTVISPGT